MPKTTKKAEKEALAKARRKIRKKMNAKQKARGDSKKGLGTKKNTHPHRVTSAKR